jgi:hypothetical protein
MLLEEGRDVFVLDTGKRVKKSGKQLFFCFLFSFIFHGAQGTNSGNTTTNAGGKFGVSGPRIQNSGPPDLDSRD